LFSQSGPNDKDVLALAKLVENLNLKVFKFDGDFYADINDSPKELMKAIENSKELKQLRLNFDYSINVTSRAIDCIIQSIRKNFPSLEDLFLSFCQERINDAMSKVIDELNKDQRFKTVVIELYNFR